MLLLSIFHNQDGSSSTSRTATLAASLQTAHKRLTLVKVASPDELKKQFNRVMATYRRGGRLASSRVKAELLRPDSPLLPIVQEKKQQQQHRYHHRGRHGRAIFVVLESIAEE
ncbi:hypothetical protein E8E14_001689 [Neopestalotiopsis sp. 37M]|nr:hypothetical protein E8E14_001689 [Neopestalotiopsis sp. 37M]